MLKKLKIIIYIFLFGFLFTAIAEESKIVYIDMDYIFKNSLAGKSINTQIETKKKNNKEKVKLLEEKIRDESQDINNQKNILSETEIKERVEELNKKIKDLQNQVKENNNLITKMTLDGTTKILKELKPILSQYSEKNNISLMLQKKNVIIGKNDLNITSDIIKIIDDKVKKIDINWFMQTSLNKSEIRNLLPHREPMLLIDELINIKKLFSATAIVNVKKNSFFVQGHFPDQPVMPGVLIVEAFGQAAAALTAAGIDKSEYENKLVFLMSVEKARFRNPVIPDCKLELNIEAIRSHGKVWKYKGEAFVNGTKMADAQWAATIVDRK